MPNLYQLLNQLSRKCANNHFTSGVFIALPQELLEGYFPLPCHTWFVYFVGPHLLEWNRCVWKKHCPDVNKFLVEVKFQALNYQFSFMRWIILPVNLQILKSCLITKIIEAGNVRTTIFTSGVSNIASGFKLLEAYFPLPCHTYLPWFVYFVGSHLVVNAYGVKQECPEIQYSDLTYCQDALKWSNYLFYFMRWIILPVNHLTKQQCMITKTSDPANHFYLRGLNSMAVG